MDNHKQKLTDIFPLNLARDIFDDEESAMAVYMPNLPVVLDSLTEREAGVLRKRYEDRMTLRAIGAIYSVTQERIRQIEAKALRKLRYPSRINLIKAVPLSDVHEQEVKYQKLSREYEHLAKAYEALVNQQAEAKTVCPPVGLVTIAQTTLEELNLSVRSYNCLRRAGKQTLQDIASMSLAGLSEIRNLGRKSAEEIVECTKKYGIEWD